MMVVDFFEGAAPGGVFAFLTAGYVGSGFDVGLNSKYDFATGVQTDAAASTVVRYSQTSDSLNGGWGIPEFCIVPGGPSPNGDDASKYTYASDSWDDSATYPVAAGATVSSFGPPTGQLGRDTSGGHFNNSDRGIQMPQFICQYRVGGVSGDYHHPFVEYIFATDTFQIEATATAANVLQSNGFANVDTFLEDSSQINYGGSNETDACVWSYSTSAIVTLVNDCSFHYADSTFVFGAGGVDDFDFVHSFATASASSGDYCYTFAQELSSSNPAYTGWGHRRYEFATGTVTRAAAALTTPRYAAAATSNATAAWIFGGEADDFDADIKLVDSFDFATETAASEIELTDGVWATLAFSSAPGNLDV
jgi:hypothetical protein